MVDQHNSSERCGTWLDCLWTQLFAPRRRRFDGDSAPAGTYIKRQKIDVLEIEYDQFTENQYNDDCSDCSLPAILQKFPWLQDLLGCWLGNVSTTGNRLIRLFRN